MNRHFIETLVAKAPHPEIYPLLKAYEPLIGAWDFDWVGHNEDGSTWNVPGEWHFAWVLEGKAVQDSWICPSVVHRGTGEYPLGQYGTTIRFYDKGEDCVKAAWIGAVNPQFNILRMMVEGSQIVHLEIPLGEKPLISKWLFRDITESTFKWEAYVSADGGKSWQLTQEVFAQRREDAKA